MIKCDWCERQMRIGHNMTSITRINQGMSMGPDMTEEICQDCGVKIEIIINSIKLSSELAYNIEEYAKTAYNNYYIEMKEKGCVGKEIIDARKK